MAGRAIAVIGHTIAIIIGTEVGNRTPCKLIGQHRRIICRWHTLHQARGGKCHGQGQKQKPALDDEQIFLHHGTVIAQLGRAAQGFILTQGAAYPRAATLA